MSEDKHTPEPWAAGPHNYTIIDPTTGYLIALTRTNNLRRRDDIRRIVACVNACAGIPLDWLESGLPGCLQNVRTERDALAQENKRLREALVNIQRCDYAARVEGLVEELAQHESYPGSLRDLVERRLLHMTQYADEALATVKEKP